ncbi:MAG: DUF1571 domain-containing protein [Bacteroidia bacterium]|nr:DUF1571 domain-containing protein [Bacteroidia bacterium]
MNKISRALLPLCVLLLLAAKPAPSGPNAWSVVNQMFTKTKGVNSMSYVMTKRERMFGEITNSKSLIKVTQHPYQAYLKRLDGDGGVEVLYREGWNSNKMLINPNGFPWVNVSFPPLSDRVRKGNHHTILDNGYRRMVGYLENQLASLEGEFEQVSQIEEVVTGKGIPCWKVVINNPYYAILSHNTKEGETVQSVADKYGVNAYRLLELNGWDAYDDMRPNQTIQVPSHYCKKAILHINKDNFLPEAIEIHDDKGFYEAYDYEQVKINPGFTELDFSDENPAYGF